MTGITRLELWGLATLVGLYLAADAALDGAGDRAVNMAGPLMLALLLSYGAWRTVGAESHNIWTALFWFRISTATYFGVGTFLVFVMNAVTQQHLLNFYAFDDTAVLKLNVIVAVSALVVLGASHLTLAVVAPRRGPRDTGPPPRSTDGLLWIGAAFLIVGLTVEYAFVVPYKLKWTDEVLPGSVGSLSNLIPVGIFMTTAWSIKRSWSLFPMIVAIVVVRSLTSLLMFEKSTLLQTLMLFLLGILWTKLTLRRLLLAATIMSATYLAIVPIVDFGRHQMELRYGDHFAADVAERWEVLTAYVCEGKSDGPENEIQSHWARLSYVNQATFAISLYDSGWPGNSLSLLPAVAIPRFLWPDKPIITQVATDFNIMATGIETSASSPTLFGEAYWNFGWAGIPICMAPLGALLALLSLHTAWVFRTGRWIYLPIVIIGLSIGLRTDGMIVADVAGASVILVGMLIALALIERSVAAIWPGAMGKAVPA